VPLADVRRVPGCGQATYPDNSVVNQETGMTPTIPSVFMGQRDSWQKSSAERWQTIREAIKDWGPTARLCLVLFVVQIPLDIGAVVWLLAYLVRK
jgi:hypothetical protein